MANYVYRCEACPNIVEEFRSIHLGPRKGKDRLICPSSEYDSHLALHSYMNVVIQPSSLEFGDFEQGDDDFSLRYRPAGKDQLARPNRTQNKTNVNSIFRKWGKKGMPLEARTDIDSTKATSKPLPATYDIDGHQKSGGHVAAPALLRGDVPVLHTSDLH